MHISLIYYLSVTINMHSKTNLAASFVIEELNFHLKSLKIYIKRSNKLFKHRNENKYLILQTAFLLRILIPDMKNIADGTV